MVKETQKAKITRLENEVDNSNKVIQKLNNEILKMRDHADKAFDNSTDYSQMKNHIEYLESKIKLIEDSVKHYKKMYEHELKKHDKLIQQNQEFQKLINEKTTKGITNIRGAGRKPVFSEEDKNEIRECRREGKTIKELAKIYSCSVGLIHKIINE